MSQELESPTRELAQVFRTLVLTAAKLGELLARRRELMLRRSMMVSQQQQREVARRIAAEQRLAEQQLRSSQSMVRALAGVDPSRIADVYRTATAWRSQSTLAEETAAMIETHMRAFGIDPAQLQAAARDFARRVEPTLRPGLDMTVRASEVEHAGSDTAEAASTWAERLRGELAGLRAASLAGLGEQARPALDALDREDRTSAREYFRRSQGLGESEPISEAMFAEWREGEARRWAGTSRMADLALFAALVSEEEAHEPGSGPAAVLTDLWLAWRVRQREGLAHPDLTRMSASAFSLQLDRAHEWTAANDPDFYRDWARGYTIDPARSDRHLVSRYERAQANTWAEQLGGEVWKYGFARTVAEHPGADLDEIAHRVWVAAGKPTPVQDPDVATTTVQEQWQQQIEAAGRWAEASDPEAWRDWQTWRRDPGVSPAQLAHRDAMMVADFHTAAAEQWAAAARREGTLDVGVATATPAQLMAAWRSHSAGAAVPQSQTPPPVTDLARAEQWFEHSNPVGYMAWRAHVEASAEHDRERLREELIRERAVYDARRGLEAFEAAGLIEEGTATGPDDEVLEQWQRITAPAPGTAEDNAQTPPGSGSQATQQNSQQGQSAQAAGGTTATPSLSDLVGTRVPENVRRGAAWARIERTFTNLVRAGADPTVLAEAVAGIRFSRARDPDKLAAHVMRQALAEHREAGATQAAGQDPAATQDPAANEAGSRGPSRLTDLLRGKVSEEILAGGGWLLANELFADLVEAGADAARLAEQVAQLPLRADGQPGAVAMVAMGRGFAGSETWGPGWDSATRVALLQQRLERMFPDPATRPSLDARLIAARTFGTSPQSSVRPDPNAADPARSGARQPGQQRTHTMGL
ncbi:hypothetical protein ACTD5D_39995 [Nocardia takedensis]|uniref:hypothetical protein n=1 Tax=Nocardia takedensis TaxID=259390 RepID=UPI003F76DD68